MTKPLHKFMMVAYWTVLMLGGLILFAKADDTQSGAYFKYGLGIFNSAKNSKAEVKMVSVGHQSPIFGYMIKQWEVGGWMDSRSDLGRKSSGFANGSIGVNIDIGNFYAQSLWGAGVVTTRDSMLGGNFQFNQDLGLGLKDSRGVGIGLNYKHISSAGIFKPNEGRDFFAIKLTIPW